MKVPAQIKMFFIESKENDVRSVIAQREGRDRSSGKRMLLLHFLLSKLKTKISSQKTAALIDDL